MLTFRYDQLDSTSDQAKRLIGRDADGPFVVVADQQTAGRGRSGRPWLSPMGGLWMTVAWPMGQPREAYVPIPVVVGWSVLGSIRQALPMPLPLELKWPNDVLLAGKKVAGVLCEQVGPLAVASGSGPWLLVGVGINANFCPSRFGGGLRFPATTLMAAAGQRVDLDLLTARCIRRITRGIRTVQRGDLTPRLQQLLQTHLAWINRPVSLRVGGYMVMGQCRGLDALGRLQLSVDGRLRVYDAGEVEQLAVDPVPWARCQPSAVTT